MRRSVRSKSARSASSRSGSSGSTERPETGDPGAASALYVHVPFCVVKCGYCDFNSFADVPEGTMAAVVDALLAELGQRAVGLRPRTVFVGGGTPTHLPHSELARLLDGVIATFDGATPVELTCEANPESCSEESLQLISDKGFTRISIGFQSFDAARLRFLDRAHGAADAIRAYERARAGSLAVNIDLIFGVPGQTLEGWQGELERAIELGPDHLSCYHLTFEPGTRLHADRERGRVAELPDELGRDMLLWTRERLADAGYEAYEISNFSRPGAACAHNLNYWRGGDYVGIGPGAATHRAGRRWTNLRPLDGYSTAVRSTGCAAWSAETLAPEHRCREGVWLGLRLAEGVDLGELSERTGADARRVLEEPLRRSLEDGSCRWLDQRLCLSPEALVHADLVAARFLGST